jgi:gas vesicle protein
MSSGKVLLGLLAGITAGALAGILFAPAKGSKTRRRIIKRGEDYAEGLTDKFNEFVEHITEKFEQVQKEVTGFVDEKMAKSEESDKNAKTARN